jgi:hypothetical protein
MTRERVGWYPVSAATVQLGDTVNLNGRYREVVNMFVVSGNRKRLIFADGGTYCLGEFQRLHALRAPR